MDIQSQVDTFLDSLYGAALEPQLWPSALDQLRQLLEGNGCHLAVIDLATGAVAKPHWIGYKNIDEFLALGDVIITDDPWMGFVGRELESAMARGAPTAYFHGAAHIAPAEYRRTRFYQEIVRKVDGHDSLAGMSLINGRWVMGVATNVGGNVEAFGTDKTELFKSLFVHINRAFRLNHRVETATPAVAGARQLWERCDLPFLIVRERKLEYTNAAARDLLDQDSVLVECCGLLGFADPQAQEAFEAISKGRDAARQQSMLCALSNGGRWLVQMTRIEPREDSLLSRITDLASSVLIILTPLSRGAIGRSAAIAGFSDLSSAERSVLSALVSGKTVEQISVETARSTETVRWHVRNMIEKTGAQSLADLTRLGALLLPF